MPKDIVFDVVVRKQRNELNENEKASKKRKDEEEMKPPPSVQVQ